MNVKWRRLHNEEFHSLYHSLNKDRAIKARRVGWEGHVARMEEGRGIFKSLTGTLTGKTPRRRWEVNFRMDLQEIGINAGNWVNLAQDMDYWRALVNAALNPRVS